MTKEEKNPGEREGVKNIGALIVERRIVDRDDPSVVGAH